MLECFAQNTQTNDQPTPKLDTIRIHATNNGAIAGAIYYNNGLIPNTDSEFYKRYGLPVAFDLITDMSMAEAAWIADDVDILSTTLDVLPTQLARLADYEPRIVCQLAWSRGQEKILAHASIETLKDLKRKKVAIELATPSHSLLLAALEKHAIPQKTVKLQGYKRNEELLKAVKAQKKIAAIATHNADKKVFTNRFNGNNPLYSTKEEPKLIAHIFIVKNTYFQANIEALRNMYKVLMEAHALSNHNKQVAADLVQVMQKSFGVETDIAQQLINEVYHCTHGDNINFLGINKHYKDITGEALYESMSEKYQTLMLAPENCTAWKKLIAPDIVVFTQLSGKKHKAEKVPKQ